MVIISWIHRVQFSMSSTLRRWNFRLSFVGIIEGVTNMIEIFRHVVRYLFIFHYYGKIDGQTVSPTRALAHRTESKICLSDFTGQYALKHTFHMQSDTYHNSLIEAWNERKHTSQYKYTLNIVYNLVFEYQPYTYYHKKDNFYFQFKLANPTCWMQHHWKCDNKYSSFINNVNTLFVTTNNQIIVTLTIGGGLFYRQLQIRYYDNHR